jgi:hypothetical protein
MRNDSARWDAPGPIDVTSQDLTVTAVPAVYQHWVSGIDVMDRYADQIVGWPDIVTTQCYALALRRDRVLLVGEADATLGYSDDTGLAVSDVSDGWQVADISGPNALECLRRGAELDLAQPSRSVMRRVFGLDVMLYRTHDETRFRVHVEKARSHAFFTSLTQAHPE